MYLLKRKLKVMLTIIFAFLRLLDATQEIEIYLIAAKTKEYLLIYFSRYTSTRRQRSDLFAESSCNLLLPV